MSDKIYCKDCRFCQSGYCHRMPPVLVSWHKNALFPKVDIFDWCGMAERREDAKPEFVTVGKIDDDYVYVIARGELENMKEENNELKERVEKVEKKADQYRIGVNRLLQELRNQCGHFNSSNFCCRWGKNSNGSYHDCENISHCRTYALIVEYTKKDWEKDK